MLILNELFEKNNPIYVDLNTSYVDIKRSVRKKQSIKLKLFKYILC